MLTCAPAAFDDELRAAAIGDRATEPRPNQRQHQIERRDAAGACDAVAINRVEIIEELDVGEFFADRTEVLPVDGAAVARKQTGLGQRKAAGAKRTERHVLACQPSER